MEKIGFEAPEYQSDGSFLTRRFDFSGDQERGWRIHREGVQWLELPAGYRLLQTRACGICATDLARRFLPFRLPQVTGHEIVAQDENGQRWCVEINASHATRMRGIENCPFCSRGLGNHCPERLVLGIHDLPGGFGPYVLAPVGALKVLPDEIPDSTAVLVEPLAAALHAVDSISLRSDDRIAVLGPRRLGMLVIAALRARRDELDTKWRIIALTRHRHLLDLASRLGADEGILVEADGQNIPDQSFDILIDTTGSPVALEQGVRMTRRELHLKSTHGQPAGGLRHLTEFVVDELSLQRWDPSIIKLSESEQTVFAAWLTRPAPPRDESAVLQGNNAAELLRLLESRTAFGALPRTRYAVVSTLHDIDSVIRPTSGREASVLEPRGTIFVSPEDATELEDSVLMEAVVKRDLKLSSSRCGDFDEALRLLMKDGQLRQIGREFISHVLSPSEIEEAFCKAASPQFVKIVVSHRKMGSDLT